MNDHMMGRYPPVDTSMLQALRNDGLQREMDRVLMPTNAERERAERDAVAYAFEHGDHQPDGRVLPPKRSTLKYHAANPVHSDPSYDSFKEREGEWKQVPVGSEVVLMNVHLLMTHEEAYALRTALKHSPASLFGVLRALQKEAVAQLKKQCGLAASPLE